MGPAPCGSKGGLLGAVPIGGKRARWRFLALNKGSGGFDLSVGLTVCFLTDHV